jgi:hypothetical protein
MTMSTSLRTRFASFSFASVMTLAILFGVNGLAVAEAPANLAAVAAPSQAA